VWIHSNWKVRFPDVSTVPAKAHVTRVPAVVAAAPAASAISLVSIAPTRNGSHAKINCKSITHCKNPKLRQLTHGTNSDTATRQSAGSVSAKSRRLSRALCSFLLRMISREENLFYLFFFWLIFGGSHGSSGKSTFSVTWNSHFPVMKLFRDFMSGGNNFMSPELNIMTGVVNQDLMSWNCTFHHEITGVCHESTFCVMSHVSGERFWSTFF